MERDCPTCPPYTPSCAGRNGWIRTRTLYRGRGQSCSIASRKKSSIRLRSAPVAVRSRWRFRICATAQWKLIRKAESFSSSPSRNQQGSSLNALSSWRKSRNRVRCSQSATRRAHLVCSNGCGHFHSRRDALKYVTGKCSSPKVSSGHNSPPGVWRHWLKPINPNLQEASIMRSPDLLKKYEVDDETNCPDLRTYRRSLPSDCCSDN